LASRLPLNICRMGTTACYTPKRHTPAHLQTEISATNLSHNRQLLQLL
jgi:hypothetical protein